MLRSAVWFLTWRCNFNCPYCWERQRQTRGECQAEPFHDYKKLVSGWNKMKPKVLDITGGEPFMQPDFISMLKEMDDSINIAITTNLSFDITRFVQEITPKKVFSMTLSLHPTGNMSIDVFIGKAMLLQKRGFKITVNFVAYPEQMWLIAMYRKMFTDAGINFHVDPYAQTEYYPFEFSDKEKKYVAFFTGEDRKNAFDTMVRPVMCSGGYDHIAVFPDGSIYRCVNDKIKGVDPLGSLFDNEITLNYGGTPCEDYNKCAGCDRDKVSVKDAVEVGVKA